MVTSTCLQRTHCILLKFRLLYIHFLPPGRCIYYKLKANIFANVMKINYKWGHILLMKASAFLNHWARKFDREELWWSLSGIRKLEPQWLSAISWETCQSRRTNSKHTLLLMLWCLYFTAETLTLCLVLWREVGDIIWTVMLSTVDKKVMLRLIPYGFHMIKIKKTTFHWDATVNT